MIDEQTEAQRVRIREDQLFLALTVAIGVIAGLSAVLFAVAIDQTSHRLFGLAPGRARLLLIPPALSIVTGVLLAKVFPDVRGSGVPQTKAAYYLTNGVIRARVPFGKFLTGVLCIASGHSLGREGPSVQIGAGVASVIGRWFRLPPRLVRNLVPVGAAAALAAAFNTPLSAVVFTLEEIIGDMNATVLGSTVVASVTAVVVERSILGNEPLFHVPAYHLVHPAELVAYAALGVVGGILSVLFTQMLLRTRAQFQSMPARTRIFQPAMGGLLVGIILVFVPGVMGVGYPYVDQALNGGLLFKTMVLLCIVKLIATIISYSSGNAGGIFAPSLYIGAMAGGAVGIIVRNVAPFPTADVGAYALVGMGALFAGIVRAPLTSVFMIFEITQDYQIVVPLMVANMLSYTIARHYQKAPIYEALLHQDDIHLPGPGAHGISSLRSARHLMHAPDALMPVTETVENARALVIERNQHVVLVGDANYLAGSLSRFSLDRGMREGAGSETVASLVEDGFVHVHPDHALDIVLERFEQSSGVLPVVSRADVHRLEGVITVDTIMRYLREHGGPRGVTAEDPSANPADATNEASAASNSTPL